MRLAHFSGHAIHEVPDVIRCLAAVVAFRRIPAGAERALADGGVTIGWHHGDHVHPVMIKHRAHEADRLAEQFLIRVAQVVVRAGLEAPLAAIQSIPVRMFFEHLLMVGQRVHAVRGLDAIGIAQADAHRPPGHVGSVDPKAHIEAADGKIRPHGLIDARLRKGLHGWHHLANFTRHVPARPESHEKAADGVE